MIFNPIKSLKNKNPENEIIDCNKITYKGSKIDINQLISEYFSRISGNRIKVDKEKYNINRFYFLPEYSNNQEARNNYTKQLFNLFSSKIKKKPIDKIDTFFISEIYPFGNSVVILNNLIFYCEVIGCHEIILQQNLTRRQWLIKNPIYIEKSKITIKLGLSADCDADNILCPTLYTWDPFQPVFVRPQLRTQYLKEEILRNIPEVNVDPDDLYIHLRGGDVFQPGPSAAYAQPPLCFYEKIINNNKFKHIYILSMDRLNVVLDALINKHNDIIFKLNSYEYDLSLLIHAFNIVGSTSSFVISSIKFNDNLKNLWEYDIYRLSEKYVALHHHLYKLDNKFNIYTMKPSDIYADKMFVWENSESQLKLMLEDTCPYDFVLTKQNI